MKTVTLFTKFVIVIGQIRADIVSDTISPHILKKGGGNGGEGGVV